MPNDRSTRLRFGAFLVDLHTHELWKHGTRLKLSGQPFEILAILLTNPGQLDHGGGELSLSWRVVEWRAGGGGILHHQLE